MKRLTFFIGLLLTFSNLAAQKKVEKNYNAKSIDEVYTNLKFADKIEIKNWNKNQVSVSASVNINDNNGNDSYSLKSDVIGKTLTIKSDFGNYFKREWKKGNKWNNCENNIEINYVIYVPQNIALEVKSISGSVIAEAYKGALKLDLISGNIDIKKHSDNMRLKTISGDIDIYIADAEFRAETLSGNVYSDLDLDFSNKKRGYGSKINATVKNGKASLRLKTISGDIFLRKI